MKLLIGSNSNNLFSKGAAVSIGNFDGVHLGHQALLTELKNRAKLLKLPAVVLLFEPQPGEYFRKEAAPARLFSLREKVAAIKKIGIDAIFCLRFNQNIANMGAEQFANDYLFSHLNARFLMVGCDFRFGAKRLGNYELLAAMADKYCCTISSYPDYCLNNFRVSSTRIRQLLQEGELSAAAQLLGRNYSLCGRVMFGSRRGHQWGIPTANINLGRKTRPLAGVFCVRVKRSNGETHDGVANIGTRPSVDGRKIVLEVHLLDFIGNLYGEMLEIDFLHKLRDEYKFSEVEALISQIRKDITDASHFFQIA